MKLELVTAFKKPLITSMNLNSNVNYGKVNFFLKFMYI